MFFGKVFFAGLLVLYTYFCLSTVKGENVNATTPPTIGFWKFVFRKLHREYLANRVKNNATIEALDYVWNNSFSKIVNEVSQLADKVKQISQGYDEMADVDKSNLGIVQKTIKKAAMTAQLTTQGFGLLQFAQGFLGEIVVAFGSLPSLLTEAFKRNFNFLKSETTYIPTELGGKLKIFFGQVMDVLNIVKAKLIAVQEQLQDLSLKFVIASASVIIPAQRFMTAITDQVKIILSKMLIRLSQAGVAIANMRRSVETTVGKIIGGMLERPHPIADAIFGTIKNIGEGILGVGNMVGNMLHNMVKGIFNHNPPGNSTTMETTINGHDQNITTNVPGSTTTETSGNSTTNATVVT